MEENQLNQNQLNQGVNGTMEPNQNQNAINTPAPSDTQNLDVLLQDPKLQAEFDKKLDKAIAKALKAQQSEHDKQTMALKASVNSEKEKMRENILEEIEAKKKEAEEMAKLSVEERYKKQIDNQELKIAEYEKELSLIRRRDKITAMVTEKGYDPRLLNLLRAEDISTDDEIEDYVDKRNAVFLEATNARVQTLLKDHPDVLLGDKKKKNTEPEFNFNFATKK
jgi:hypothetical protein